MSWMRKAAERIANLGDISGGFADDAENIIREEFAMIISKAFEQLLEIYDIDMNPKSHDNEETHSASDETLCMALESLGANDIANLFRKMRDEVPFWYA